MEMKINKKFSASFISPFSLKDKFQFQVSPAVCFFSLSLEMKVFADKAQRKGTLRDILDTPHRAN